jgi:hypothetical protein
MIFENVTNTTIWIEEAVVPIRPGERFYINENRLKKTATAFNKNGSGLSASVKNMISMGWIREIKTNQEEVMIQENEEVLLTDPILAESYQKKKAQKKKKSRVVTRAEVPHEKKKAVDVDRWDFIL